MIKKFFSSELRNAYIVFSVLYFLVPNQGDFEHRIVFLVGTAIFSFFCWGVGKTLADHFKKQEEE